MKKIIFLFIMFFLCITKIKAISNIEVSNYTLVPSFEKDIHIYNVYVPSNKEIIKISVSCDEEETITGEGTESLIKGLNTFNINVYNNDQIIDSYILNIIRGEVIYDENSSYINKLSIKGIPIDFDKNVYNYEVFTTLDYIDVDYSLDNPMSTSYMNGDIFLIKKENLIKVKVVSENKKNESTYSIKIIKTNIEENSYKKKEMSKELLYIIRSSVIIVNIFIIILLFNILFVKKTSINFIKKHKVH